MQLQPKYYNLEFPTETSSVSSMDKIPDLSSDEEIIPEGDMYSILLILKE